MGAIEDLPLIPEDEFGGSADDAVDAATAALEDATSEVEDVAEVPEPFGRTPLFDFERGRFAQKGGDVVYVSGLDAIKQWCLMVIHSGRYAHAVFSDDFGMEDPDSLLGESADLAAAVSDWGERLRDALLVHDRITALEDFEAHYTEVDGQGVVVIDNFTVVTDEDDQLEFGNLTVGVEV